MVWFGLEQDQPRKKEYFWPLSESCPTSVFNKSSSCRFSFSRARNAISLTEWRERRVANQQLINDISTQFATVLLTLASNKIGSKRADRWKSWLTTYCDDFPYQFCSDCGLKMSSAMPKDPNHTITENGVHCSNSDCALPMCINSKLGNLIKKSTDCKRAEKSKATTDTSLKNAADYKVNSLAANRDM